MRTHDPLKSEEASNASWAAAKGAVIGAAKWGAAAAFLGGIGYVWSPIYKGTTVQFKVYLQMSGMVLGGMIDADNHLRQYETKMRTQRRWMRERAKWDRYEEEIAQESSKK